MRGGGGRLGVSLVEVVLALAVTLALAGTVTATVALQARGAGRAMHRIQVLEARRVAREQVGRTVAAGGLADSASARAAVPVRHFVGWALPCGDSVWAYQGFRRPDPRRDSLWVAFADGRVAVRELGGARARRCPGRAPAAPGVQAFSLAPWPGPGAVLVRAFERGRYRVDDAVRYGRRSLQPLTGPVLDPARSGLDYDGWELRLRLTGAGDSLTWRRAWRR